MKDFQLTAFGNEASDFKIEASVALLQNQSNALLRWVVYGPIEKLLLEEAETELWKHTCFEFFLNLEGQSYLEWNFSPFGNFKVFHFESYRKLARISSAPSDDAVLSSESSQTKNRLVHEVKLELNLIPKKGQKGSMTAVLKTKDGKFSYWAVEHCREKADFHALESFHPL